MARLDRGPVSGAACGPDMPAIEVRSLSFAYPDADAAVLEGLDWSVPQGAFALLVGGTGSGKSTLLSLLKPEIAPAGERTGELRVLGENVADMDARASAERVGYVFQDPENQIVCETVWHEMAFGLENLGVSRERCAAVLPRPAISLVWRTGFIAIPTRFRVAASSCCRLPPSWRCVRVCCYSTSPRLSSIPLPRRIFCTRCFA